MKCGARGRTIFDLSLLKGNYFGLKSEHKRSPSNNANACLMRALNWGAAYAAHVQS
jgi:hypothetical protein